MQRHLAALVFSATLAWTPQALAEDTVTSDALFQRGVDDMMLGRFDTACPAIAESLRLDPRPGTLFTLAECYAKGGKLASAVVRYDEYLTAFSRMTPEQQSKQLGREKTALEQRDLLKPEVPLLTVRLEAGAPADTRVMRNDTLLNGPSLGVALPVDPGEHTVSAQTPNGPRTTQTLTIQKGERKEISLEVEVTTVTTMSTTSKTGGSAAPKAKPPTGSRGDTQRIVALALGGVGVAGLLTGAIAGGVTLARKSSVEQSCDLDAKKCSTSQGLDELSSARTSGVVSTVGFAAGGALLATGLIVFLTAPSERTAETSKDTALPELRVGFDGQSGFATLTGVFQ
jgi:hypothetical protein